MKSSKGSGMLSSFFNTNLKNKKAGKQGLITQPDLIDSGNTKTTKYTEAESPDGKTTQSWNMRRGLCTIGMSSFFSWELVGLCYSRVLDNLDKERKVDCVFLH